MKARRRKYAAWRQNHFDREELGWKNSETEYFFHSPDHEKEIFERTQNLSPDIMLFTILAGVAAATYIIRGQLISFLFSTFQRAASYLLDTDLTDINKGG